MNIREVKTDEERTYMGVIKDVGTLRMKDVGCLGVVNDVGILKMKDVGWLVGLEKDLETWQVVVREQDIWIYDFRDGEALSNP